MLTDRHTDRHTDTKTDRQTDGHEYSIVAVNNRNYIDHLPPPVDDEVFPRHIGQLDR